MWGVITGLGKELGISRPFIYSLLNTFKEESAHLFFPKKTPDPISREAVEARILSLRFEGRSSINAVSTLLKHQCSFVNEGLGTN